VRTHSERPSSKTPSTTSVLLSGSTVTMEVDCFDLLCRVSGTAMAHSPSLPRPATKMRWGVLRMRGAAGSAFGVWIPVVAQRLSRSAGMDPGICLFSSTICVQVSFF
jgi:hypothetical protein